MVRTSGQRQESQRASGAGGIVERDSPTGRAANVHWLELRFEPPADGMSTQLSADKPVFWEFEVELDLPGLDFKETYLVPVYGRKESHPNARPATTSSCMT
jgi:hypothetical protein